MNRIVGFFSDQKLLLGKFIKNFSLKRKLILTVSFLTLLATFITAYIAYRILYNYAAHEVNNSELKALEKTMSNIDDRLKDIESLYFNILTNQRLMEMFTNLQPSEEQKLYYTKLFADDIYFNIFGAKSEYMDSVYIFGVNGVNLISNRDPLVRQRPFDELAAMDIIKKADAADGKTVWLPTDKNRFVDSPIVNNVITGVRKLHTYRDNYKMQGFLIINLKERFIYEVYNEMLKSVNGYMYITDNRGKIISYSDKDKLAGFIPESIIKIITDKQYGTNSIALEKSRYDVRFFTSGYSGWKIVSITQPSSLKESLMDIRNTILIVTLIIIVISIFLSNIIAASITRPIGALLKHMQKIQKGDFDAKLDGETSGEVGSLTIGFNHMAYNLKQLMLKVVKDQEELRKAELKALQAQIKPHFLYNALDTVYWFAKTREHEKIEDMVVALANFYRLGLNKGNDITTVGKEVEHAENYLVIQRIRYGDKFEYKIDIDREICGNKCIKFILQPLLENSLLHGFKGMKKGGSIKIFGRKENGRILLEVIDNGSGIDAERMQDSLQCTSGKTVSGYALRNVNDRIRLYFGEGYGVRFVNVEDDGTCVQVIMPVDSLEEG